MQNIFKLIRSMNFKGLSLSVENGFLKVEPRSLITDSIRAKVKKHRAGIISALSGTPLDPFHGGTEIPSHSCWACGHYDGRGSAWPGMCQSSYPSKEIDTNPDDGCRYFVKVGQGAMKASAPRVTRKNSLSLVAVSWLAENKKALKDYGWTMPELYRRNKWKRGIAWLKIWDKKGLSVDISPDGCMVFSFPGTNGRMIRQTARPVSYWGS